MIMVFRIFPLFCVFVFFALSESICKADIFYFTSGDTAIQNNCKDTFLCNSSEMQNYDFRSQYATFNITPGDSLTCTIILYAKQNFRIMVCGDAGYNNINFKVIEPSRETIQKVNKINESEEIIYKLDEYGEPVLDSDDKPVVLSKDILRDTIWDKTVLQHETLLFEGSSGGKNFFDISKNETTRRVLIKIFTSGTKTTTPSCVSIMVGRKYNKPFQISAQ